MKPKGGPNMLPIFRVYHNHSFKPLIPPHFRTQNQDMCHDIIDSGLIKIESQLGWEYVIL